MKISPAKKIHGTLALPGDKSISHRAAILAALAEGATRIENFAPGADCASTLSCLRQLGVGIERDGNIVTIYGVGKHGLKAPAAELDCGNSGSTMRMLAGVLAGQDFTSVLIGDESLSRRPMQRIIEPLTQMGASIGSIDGHAPLEIKGKYPLSAIRYIPSKPSAQLKSCVLLAGLFGDGPTQVMETIPTRDHTERLLPHFGAFIGIKDETGGRRIDIRGGGELTANDIVIPGDISSAAFFLIAAACCENSELVLKSLGLNPSRMAIVEVLKDFGADIEITNEILQGREPSGDVVINSKKLRPGSNIINAKLTTALIDEIPVLAILGTQLENGLEIRDAQELRVKESDRIKSTVENLKLMGAAVEEFPDGLRVGKSKLKGAAVDSFGDHRIAMAFAVAGLLAEGETEIIGADCVTISYPNFFRDLAAITQ
ncbi:MAG TPA: 3-phosphoshikimate 1-carboxyvinyltransferase [Pyrinomonadaceae bacterium]|jgi:3-phosphoshikimate 1-carboxyvinyltransferase|nr:3-phosphoshikimate 1-carboxyvinyltransferase [Pyrinomonadaceae bacterium]